MMQCAADSLPLTGILGTSHPVSRSKCAAMCSVNGKCNSFDICQDGTCRLRGAFVTTTCAAGTECSHYEKGELYKCIGNTVKDSNDNVNSIEMLSNKIN
jgi:hypothetical protein